MRQENQISLFREKRWGHVSGCFPGKFRMMLEEAVDLEVVLLGLERTGGVHQQAAGFDDRGE
jgi:hypothetical protein